jgi:hypothetical protein
VDHLGKARNDRRLNGRANRLYMRHAANKAKRTDSFLIRNERELVRRIIFLKRVILVDFGMSAACPFSGVISKNAGVRFCY